MEAEKSNRSSRSSAGSAMIIATLLMASVAGVVFAIGRLLYLDTSISGIYENSIIAYYASESGIEEGLLRYRFNRQEDIDGNRINLSDLSVVTIPSAVSVPDPARFYDDLSIINKAKFYGNDVNKNGIIDINDIKDVKYGEEFTIPRDEAIKIDISDSLSADLKLFLEFGNYLDGFDKNRAFVEAKVVGAKISGGAFYEYKKILVSALANPQCAVNQNSCVAMTAESALDKDIYSRDNLRVAISGSVILRSSGTDRVYLYLKPIGAGATIGIDVNSKNDNSIASPYTTIKSTGYFGGVSRTLEAKVDRQSGTVYDLFDYVIYQHQ